MIIKKLITAIAFGLMAFPVLSQSPAADPWKDEMRRFSKQDSIRHPDAGVNLFTGSSSIRKWEDIQDYFPGYKILNRGFGGSQFSDLLSHLDKTIWAYQPVKIFIYEGDNDLAAGKSPAIIMEQAKELRERIAKHFPRIPVVFISPKPSIARWILNEKYIELNKLLKAYCENTKNTQFADVWTPMIGADGKPLPVFLSDNLHMTPQGYVIWQKVLAPYLNK